MPARVGVYVCVERGRGRERGRAPLATAAVFLTDNAVGWTADRGQSRERVRA